ncbi:hypothetical protein NC652_039034 [Populus alba x Populus x berolinensis]|nr:hypothetical protein NC652_039034 [Populus alba x Populus x berolinensis]
MPALSFFSLLFLKIFFFEMGMAKNSTSIIPVKVGVVLDLDNDLDGKIGLSGINMSLSDFYGTHGDYKTRLVLITRDSKNDVAGAAAAGRAGEPQMHRIIHSLISLHNHYINDVE